MGGFHLTEIKLCGPLILLFPFIVPTRYQPVWNLQNTQLQFGLTNQLRRAESSLRI